MSASQQGTGSAKSAGLSDGYYVVPPGKLANAVTWLEMRQRPDVGLAEPLRLQLVRAEHRLESRALFARIGTPWLWSRAEQVSATDSGSGETYMALRDDGTSIGIVEFAGRDTRDVEIVYFGLVPEATGRKLGRRLMAAALDLAWHDADRVWLHTCNFDHPGALPFYRACGFVPFASGFEIMGDPRLLGRLPREAAPHVPLVAPTTAT